MQLAILCGTFSNQRMLLKFIRSQWFIVAMGLVILLAMAFPGLGASGGPLKAEWLTPLGIFIIFFIQGISLPTGELLRAGGNLRIHIFVHLWCYLGYPLLALALVIIGYSFWQPATAQGLLFLAILPTTISSALAFTAITHGNRSAALFNTVSTNLLGIIMVPALISLLMGLEASGAQSFAQTLWRLFLLIGLPLLLGQIIRRFILELLKGLIAHGGKISSSIILFIIFAAVSDSIQSGIWQNAGATYLIQTVFAVIILLVASHGLIRLSLRWVGTDPADQIAAFYTASQKTLAAGVPMAMAIFAHAEPGFTGLLVLPLIIYHPLQLMVAGLLVPYWKATTKAATQR